MRQLTFVAPGNLEWRDVPDPAMETPHDVIVRPVSVATCDLDGAAIQGVAPIPGPYPLGHEAIARVVQAGADVASVKPGDLVLVPFQISCGFCDACSRGLTGSCLTSRPGASYGLGPLGGLQWGGTLSDYVRVPFGDAMLVKVGEGMEPLASLADNVPDGWRAVGPRLEERPGAPVLILGGAGPSSVALYAVAAAKALASGGVDYVDHDRKRLEIAADLGANAIEIQQGQFPRKFGRYPIVVDHTSNTAGLAAAIRSTEPGGVCTSTAIYFGPETGVPLLEMYTRGLTYITGRVNARACVEPLLELYATGKFHPEKVTTETASWDDAIDALKSYSVKLVISRD